MTIRDLSFAWPAAAWLFLAAPLFAFFLWRLDLYRRRVLAPFTVVEGWRRLLVPRSRFLTIVHGIMLILMWCCLVIAMMGPQGRPHYLSGGGEPRTSSQQVSELSGSTMGVKRRRLHEVVILIDASASMAIADTRTGVSRLSYAKEIVDEIISRLEGQMVAVYAFTSKLTPIVPSNNNYLFTRLMLRGLEINAGDVAGTDLAEALEGLRHRHLGHSDNAKTVVLLTDGGDTALEQLAGADRQRQIEVIGQQVSTAHEDHYRIYTIGLGTRQGQVVPGVSYEGKPVVSALDEPLLDYLAALGDGRYFYANNFSALGMADAIYSTIAKDTGWVEDDAVIATGIVKRQIDADQELLYDEYFRYPLALGVLLLICALLLPEVRKAGSVAVLCLVALPLASMEQQDLEQLSLEGRTLFEAGKYQDAAAIYDKALAESLTPRQRRAALMNKAVVLLSLQQWDAAFSILQQVEVDPSIHPELYYQQHLYIAWALYNAGGERLADKEAEKALSYIARALETIEGLSADTSTYSSTRKKRLEVWYYALKDLRAQALRLQQEDRLQGELQDVLKLLLQGLTNIILQFDIIDGNLRTIPQAVSDAWSQRLSSLDRPWEALRGFFNEQENARLIHWFLLAETHSQRAKDALSEGNAFIGRVELELSLSALSILDRLQVGKPIIPELIQRRLALASRQLLSSAVLSDVAFSQRETVERWLEEAIVFAIEAPSSGEGDVAQQLKNERRIALLKELKQAVVNSKGVEATIAVEQASEDLLLYRHLDDSVGTLLLDTYIALARMVDGPQAQLRTGDLLPIKRLFHVAVRMLRVPEGLSYSRESAVKAADILAAAAYGSVEELSLDELYRSVEDALRALSLPTFASAQIARLINQYDQVLALDPLAIKALQRLTTHYPLIQETLSQFISEHSKGMLIQRDLQHSEESLNHAIQSRQSSEYGVARVFAKDARHWLRYSRERLNPAVEVAADQLLADGIAEQTRTHGVTKWIAEKGYESDYDQVLIQLVRSGQQRVAEQVNDFPDALKKSQEILGEQRYQRILDLFLEGLNAVIEAEKMKASDELVTALTLQLRCIELWTEALDLMRDESDEGAPEKDEGEGDGGEEQELHGEQSQENTSESQQVLDFLQQMEQEDSQMKPSKHLPPKQGLRPW